MNAFTTMIGAAIMEEVGLVFGVLSVFYAAIAVYSIRKKLAASARYDKGSLIAKWVGAYLVFGLMVFSSAYMGGGVGLACVLILVIVPGALILGILITPYLSGLMVSPITNAMEGRLDDHWEKPAYGPAIAARNRGEYELALSHVAVLLEKHPGDLEGLMLKASIQAENLGDLDAAKKTFDEMLSEQERLRYNLPVVYNKLADWQLNLFDDPEGARRSLERIREAYPDSKASQLASQRLASIDSLEQAESQKSDIDETFQNFASESAMKDESGSPFEMPKIAERDADLENEHALAECLNRVEEHPDSIINREELADLYLNHAKEPTLAQYQYEHLLGMPGATEKQKVIWLNKIADIQVKSGGKQEQVKATLQCIIALNPEGAGATRAQSRIMHLAIEIRAANKKNTPLKLERRDEDLGLM